MNHQEAPKGVGFLSNKYTPPEVGFSACISSRITTVIQVNQPGNYREPERRSERANPPEGSRDVPSGREKPKRPQPQASKMCETPKPRATDSIAPLSSPSCGPRQVALGYYTAYYPVTYAPQEEKTRAKSTRKRGYLTEPSRRSGETFGKASDPQTPNVAR
ncbi:hypothetical protein EJ07DRAFT_160722 [Lizonia empirigonia]|nr:hypothetical protein EJ07DRAFT_160722 [Lizonia empirigonia]